MAAPRKVFRIEELQAARLPPEEAEAAGRHTEIMQALDALRSAFAAPAAPSPSAMSGAMSGTMSGTTAGAMSNGESGRLASELNLIANRLAGGEAGNGHAADDETVPLTRIANELLAVTSGTEQATQKILAAAEQIDQLANNLSASLKGRIEQGPAQDIRELVLRIFEACNFQDLIGQRVSKVMTTLKFVEEHISSVLDEIKTMSVRPPNGAMQNLHGPRLEHDSGHASQLDIDAIFDIVND
jgi:chemotaxis protein CheZ